jgi:N-acetylglutamate synthase-like GNAT family acetyltransferase
MCEMIVKVKVRRATIADLPAMQELVRKAYIQKGYLSPTGDTVTYPDLNSNNHVAFVATCSDRIIGTITVSFGIPTDFPVTAEFPKEIQTVWEKTEKGKLAYVSRLAVEEGWRNVKVTPSLFLKVAELCVWELAEAVLCIVNPKHVNFYVEWGFEELASKAKIEELEKAPAVLLAFYQEYKTMPEEYSKMLTRTQVRRQDKRLIQQQKSSLPELECEHV